MTQKFMRLRGRKAITDAATPCHQMNCCQAITKPKVTTVTWQKNYLQPTQ